VDSAAARLREPAEIRQGSNMVRNIHKNPEKERGIILVIVAVCLVMLLGFAALVIDVAYIYTTQNQLHVAADSAALAGATQIFNSTDCAANSAAPNYQARTKAQTYAAFHKAGSAVGQTAINLSLNTGNDPNGDIILGNFNTTSHVFTSCPAGSPVNALRVRSRRNSETGTGIDPSNAPVATFFAPVLNTAFRTRDVKTFATAQKISRAGLPIAIPKCVVPPSSCSCPTCTGSSDDLTITFNPSTSDNGAWTTFFGGGGARTIRDYIANPSTIACIASTPSSTINITNGAIASALSDLQDQCTSRGCSETTPWYVQLAIIDVSCAIPGSYTFTGAENPTVIGFATFGIKEVGTGGSKFIRGSFNCGGGTTNVAQCSTLVE